MTLSETFGSYPRAAGMVVILTLLFALASPTYAQSEAASGGISLPMPVAPTIVERDDSGNITVRATRITEAIRVDGRLDDAAYSTVAPVSALVQQEPREGDLNSENTDVWVLFDDENLYFTCRCWEAHPDQIHKVD